MRTEHPVTVPLHKSENLGPGIWDASCFPVLDCGGAYADESGQCADATSGTECLVEDSHGREFITEVSEHDTLSRCYFQKDMNTLADRLKSAREAKGPIWTQAHLAVAAGVSTGTIGMMESGKRGNTGTIPGTVPQIAKALGVSYEWLAYGDDVPAPPAQVAANDDHLKLQGEQLAKLLRGIPPAQQLEAYTAALEVLLGYVLATRPTTPAAGSPAPQ